MLQLSSSSRARTKATAGNVPQPVPPPSGAIRFPGKVIASTALNLKTGAVARLALEVTMTPGDNRGRGADLQSRAV